MQSQSTLLLDVLDLPVRVDFDGDPELVARARERAASAWGRLVSEESALRPAEGTDPTRLSFTVTEEADIARLLDQLSSRATLAGIEARSGELLMLHAAGLADAETGRVVACVAPSGTGKTTLSRAAAGSLRYVTDETVAVTREGRVVRYPKPLSVKQHTEQWAPKIQHSPDSLGLEVAEHEGLLLGAIVLLRRIREDARDDGEVEAQPLAADRSPVVEDVDLFDAIVELVPELSYLSRMDGPLHWLAGTIDGVGGVRRLSYREADQAIPALQTLLREAAARDEARSDGAEPGGVLIESRDEIARWRTVVEGCAAEEDESGTPLPELAVPIEDLLSDPDRARALIFGGNTVRLVSAIAAVTLLAAQERLSSGQLRSCLTLLFGEPQAREGNADGDPIDAVLQSLIEHGLLA